MSPQLHSLTMIHTVWLDNDSFLRCNEIASAFWRKVIFCELSSRNSRLVRDNECLSSGHASVVKDLTSSEGSMTSYERAGGRGNEIWEIERGDEERATKEETVFISFYLLTYTFLYLLTRHLHAPLPSSSGDVSLTYPFIKDKQMECKICTWALREPERGSSGVLLARPQPRRLSAPFRPHTTAAVSLQCPAGHRGPRRRSPVRSFNTGTGLALSFNPHRL